MRGDVSAPVGSLEGGLALTSQAYEIPHFAKDITVDDWRPQRVCLIHIDRVFERASLRDP
jgi:hypothetical protein